MVKVNKASKDDGGDGVELRKSTQPREKERGPGVLNESGSPVTVNTHIHAGDLSAASYEPRQVRVK